MRHDRADIADMNCEQYRAPKHQQHKPQPEGTYNPDKLLAGTRREVQKVTVTIIITASDTQIRSHPVSG